MNLSERLAEAKGAPVDVGGRPIHGIFRRKVQPDEQIRLTWCRSTSATVQGIRLKVKRGTMVVGTEKLSDVVLWSDTSPSVVELLCKTRKPEDLLVWNCWRDENDTTQAWIGNSGMDVRNENDRQVLILCNSGSDVTFEDLIFRMQFTSATTANDFR